MIDVKPPEEETLKINFTEEQKQAFVQEISYKLQAKHQIKKGALGNKQADIYGNLEMIKGVFKCF